MTPMTPRSLAGYLASIPEDQLDLPIYVWDPFACDEHPLELTLTVREPEAHWPEDPLLPRRMRLGGI